MPKASTNGQGDSNRSAPMTVGIENGAGNAVLAAWQGIYHLFGGRGTFTITLDGVIVENFTVDAKYDPAQIVADISHRNRRLDLVPTYLWVQGQAPEPFADAKEMTAFMVQYFRGSVEEGSSRAPRYVRDAVANFKTENSLAKRRGPRKKIYRLENLSEIDETSLVGVNPEALAALRATIEKALASQAALVNSEPVAVTQ